MKVTLSKLKKMKQAGQKIACLTAYDATMAYWCSEANVEVILVGDSLGMVVQGHDTTLPVLLEEMAYHTRLVQRKNSRAWCIADLPFLSDYDVPSAVQSAAALMKDGLANMVKLEGGQRALPIVEALSQMGVPVCGHLGLLPQSVEKNGYRVSGRDEVSANRLLEDAIALEKAGAEMLVLECVPSVLAKKITDSVAMPVIGIGAGKETDGQVLVMTDILGVTVGTAPKFAKNFLAESPGSVQQAIELYVREVKQGHFPGLEHCVD